MKTAFEEYAGLMTPAAKRFVDNNKEQSVGLCSNIEYLHELASSGKYHTTGFYQAIGDLFKELNEKTAQIDKYSNQ